MKIYVFLLSVSLLGHLYQYLSRPAPEALPVAREGEPTPQQEGEGRAQAPAVKPAPPEQVLPAAPPCQDQEVASRSTPVPGPPLDPEQVQESEKLWEERVQSYFEEELALGEEEHSFYRERVRELREQKAKIHNYFSEQARERGWEPREPYVPSFEEERAMFRAKEAIIMKLAQRFSPEKVRKILEHERKLKETMLKEKGYSPSRGLL